jgi:hypothetical protein
LPGNDTFYVARQRYIPGISRGRFRPDGVAQPKRRLGGDSCFRYVKPSKGVVARCIEPDRPMTFRRNLHC